MNRKPSYLFILLTVLIILTSVNKSFSFGFLAHRKINRMAIFALPPEMLTFYKRHIEYITEHAIDPDKKSRVVEGEDKKHYIDIEDFGEKTIDSIPVLWKNAIAKYTEDSLQAHGINPWWINKMTYSLTQAFKDENLDLILFYSANIGHYIADACTPLHTTKWYDGEIAEQKGIHAFWETRIPELEADTYNYMLGRANYIEKPYQFFWQLIKESHAEVDSIFKVDSVLKLSFPEDKKYVYEERGNLMKKQFSKEYAHEFDILSKNMVERRMTRAVKAVSGIWFTAWVNAGQPDLFRLEDKEISKAHQKELEDIETMWKTGKPVGRINPEQ